jgi:hypothetical protein
MKINRQNKKPWRHKCSLTCLDRIIPRSNNNLFHNGEDINTGAQSTRIALLNKEEKIQ